MAEYTEETAIKNVHKDAKKLKDELGAADMPKFNIYSGASEDEKNEAWSPYGISKRSEEFIFGGTSLSTFYRKSAAVRKYFSDIEDKKAELSIKMLSILGDKVEENFQQNIGQLKGAHTPQELIQNLDKLYLGAKNSDARKLLKAVVEIEKRNQKTLQSYRDIAISQNPLFKMIVDTDKTLTDIKKKFSNGIYPDDVPVDKLIELLESMRSDPYGNEQSYPKLVDHYVNTQTGNLDHDISQLKKMSNIENLKHFHESVSSLAQHIVVQSFQTKGSPKLEEVIYSTNALDGTPSQNRIEINSAKLRQSLQRGFAGISDKDIPKDAKEEILLRVVDSFTGKNDSMKRAFAMIDEKYMHFQEKGVPTDARFEEVFQKMLEDSIYNVLMKHNGGLDRYKDAIGSEVPGNQIIDVAQNVANDNYKPIGEIGKGDLERNAIGLHNLNLLMDKIDQGSISKMEARKILSADIPFLNEETKNVLGSELEKYYGQKKLSSTFLPNGEKYNVQKETGDRIVQKYANNYLNQRYINNPVSQMFGKLGIYRKSAATLLGCLKKAENPMIRTHSSASETAQCLENAKKEIEQNIQNAKKGLESPLANAAGLSLFFLLYIAFERIHENELYNTILLSEIEREKALKFISEGLDDVEEEYRGKTLTSNMNGLESTLVDKGNYGEHLFRTIKAKNDYHKEYNPYLYKDGLPVLNTMLNASSKEEGATATVDTLKDLLKQGGSNSIKNFTQKIAQRNERMKDEYLEEKRNLNALLVDAISQKDPSKIRAAALALVDTVQKAKAEGAIDLYALKEDVEALNLRMAYQLENIASEMRGARDELSALENEARQLSQTGTQADINSMNLKIYEAKEKVSEMEQRLSSTKDVADHGKTAELDIIEAIENAEDIIPASEKENMSADQIKDRIIQNLSQKNAFDFDAGKDPKIPIEAFKTRYYSTTGRFALFQDLEAIDEQIEELLGENDKISKERILNLIALKVTLRESYITAKLSENQTLSRTQILESLFKSNPDQFVKTGDVRFGTLSHPDGKRVQVISADLSKHGYISAKNIASFINDDLLENPNAGEIVNLFETLTEMKLGGYSYENYHRPISHNDSQLTTHSDKRRLYNKMINKDEVKIDTLADILNGNEEGKDGNPIISWLKMLKSGDGVQSKAMDKMMNQKGMNR